MTIRQKLTLQFLVLSFAMLAVSFGVILFSQYSFRKEQFNDRLAYKARSIADDIENLGEFSIEQLRRIRRSSSQLFYEQVFLFDHNGSMLFAAPEAPFRFQPDTEFVNLARSKPDFFFDWEQYECYALTINAAGTQHLIVVAGYDQFGHGKMENLREFLIILLLSGLVISAFTGWFFAGKALDPVSEIVRQVDTITAGNLNTRLDEGMRRDELNRLAMTFNLMLNRIEQAFEAQKTFVANASHELRTPLTIISGRLELALLRGQQQHEYENAIREVLTDIRTLNQICTSLLVLATAHSKNQQGSFKAIRLDELVWQVRSGYLKANPDVQIEVDFEHLPEEVSDLTMMGDEHLLSTLIHNLLENAAKFSTNKKVKIHLDFDALHLVLSVHDQGPGMTADDIERITQPFYRGKQAVGKSGFGLGLAMVENIAKLHNGSLEISSVVGTGSTFKVIFLRNLPAGEYPQG